MIFKDHCRKFLITDVIQGSILNWHNQKKDIMERCNTPTSPLISYPQFLGWKSHPSHWCTHILSKDIHTPIAGVSIAAAVQQIVSKIMRTDGCSDLGRWDTGGLSTHQMSHPCCDECNGNTCICLCWYIDRRKRCSSRCGLRDQRVTEQGTWERYLLRASSPALGPWELCLPPLVFPEKHMLKWWWDCWRCCHLPSWASLGETGWEQTPF